MNVQEHVVYKLRTAAVQNYPFPHFYAEEVFPAKFYEDLRASLPDRNTYDGKGTKYHGRKFADPSDNPLLTFMNTPQFLRQIAQIFLPQLKERYPDMKLEIFHDLRLVHDGQGYQIGPHTDARWKLVSLLFYLPEDWAISKLGTSIYTPKDPNFRCEGGPHHKFDDFNLVHTIPFAPNSCFGFFKTSNSFHGVEPITIPCKRDVLLYNLYDKQIYHQFHKS